MLGPMTMMFLFILLVLVGAYLLVTVVHGKPAWLDTLIWIAAAVICVVLLVRGLGIAMP